MRRGSADANAACAEEPAGEARVCIGVVWGCVVLCGCALCGIGRGLVEVRGVCVGDVLGDDTWRA